MCTQSVFILASSAATAHLGMQDIGGIYNPTKFHFSSHTAECSNTTLLHKHIHLLSQPVTLRILLDSKWPHSFHFCLPCPCLLNLLLFFFIYSVQDWLQKGKMKLKVLSNLCRRQEVPIRESANWAKYSQLLKLIIDDVRTSLLISSTSLSMRKNLAIFSEGPCKSLCSNGTSPLLSCFFSGI